MEAKPCIFLFISMMAQYSAAAAKPRATPRTLPPPAAPDTSAAPSSEQATQAAFRRVIGSFRTMGDSSSKNTGAM